jgi:DGQHR domain-containing protein
MPNLKVNALRIVQQPDIPIYVFGVNGRLINSFASVNFAHRVKNGKLAGYQRERVTRHIADIQAYLSQATSLLPNAIVISFDERVEFTRLKGAVPSSWGTFGTLQIPATGVQERKPGFIVDGQQRATALSKLDASREFPVVVVAFQSASQKTQREQFVLVNKSKPLPRDLLNELLPSVDVFLPKSMRHRQIAATVLQAIRFDKSSPFCGRIKGLGAQGEGANISQAAVIGVIERSMKQGGVLSEYGGSVAEEINAEGAARVVNTFFAGVEKVWPSAWAGAPRNSRLVHGVGIHAMGVLMDVIMDEVDAASPRATNSVKRRLEKIRGKCRWTSGRWPKLRCAWNELQNTSQDKRRLGEYVAKEYGKAR